MASVAFLVASTSGHDASTVSRSEKKSFKINTQHNSCTIFVFSSGENDAAAWLRPGAREAAELVKAEAGGRACFRTLAPGLLEKSVSK